MTTPTASKPTRGIRQPSGRPRPLSALLLALAGLAFAGAMPAGGEGGATLSGQSREAAATPSAIDLGPVFLRSDKDHDGMPDAVEEANGTDPDDPADADGDPDGDGLSNGDEVARNLNANDPDSDGDGVSDGAEAQAGYDPNDPGSTPPAVPEIVAIAVSPSLAVLSLDALAGQQPLALRVTGDRSDGARVELTTAAGTTYQSLDVRVATVGPTGVVLGVAPGSTTIRVRNGGRQADVALTVAAFAPQALSFLAIPGSANGVDVEGDYAYVAAGQAGLVVVDASDLEAPRIAAIADTPGNANEVRVEGGFAYVADGPAGLQVIDVRDPANPALAGSVALPGSASDVALSGTRAYVAARSGGLQIVDVTVPAAPFRFGADFTPGDARGVDSDGLLAVVADGSQGVEVFDVQDPTAPRFLGRTATRPNDESHASDVVLRGRTAYVADGALFNLGGLRVVDVGVPSTPVVTGATDDRFALTALALDGPLALAADILFVNAVPVFDLGGRQPAFARAVDFSGAPAFRDDNGTGIAVRDGIVFLTGNRGLEDDAGVSDGGLHIGRYRIGDDTGGVAPQVAIVQPGAGSTAPERSPLRVRAEASDDVQVAAVEFTLDGNRIAVDTRPPFETVVQVPVAASFTLGATALDFGGNRGIAAPVEVQVVPDAAPRVSLLAPAAGDRFAEAVYIDLAAHATDDVQIDRVDFLVDGALWGSAFGPPYRIQLQVPVGVPSFTVEAEAFDSAGQSSRSGAVEVGVDDDPAPIVSVVAPAPGSTLVAGSLVEVAIGATDPQGVTRVDVELAGQPEAGGSDRPYRYTVRVPATAGPLTLVARATDTIGQEATAEAHYEVVPDPATTAEGRVVDGAGQGVEGAELLCVGLPGTSGADGYFSVPGIPTVRGRISCGVRSGADLAGRSAPVAPVAGGVTRLGDVVLAAPRLFLASGNGPELRPGRLHLFESGSGRLVPWGSGVEPDGLSGLTDDGQGTLLASTVGFSFQPGGGQSGFSKSTSPSSRLLRIDPETGAVLATIGPLSTSDGFQPALQDLTFEPASGRTFALDRDQGTLYQLDLAAGRVMALAENLPGNGNAALAAGPDGLLKLLAFDGVRPVLLTLDPMDGRTLVAEPVAGSAGGSSVEVVGGMTLEPATGTFLVTSGSGEKQLYELDPFLLQLAGYRDPEGTVEGSFLGLAFHPFPAAEAVVTDLRGRVVDPAGAPLAGAEVAGIGAFGTTGADGEFLLTGVRALGGTVRVSAQLGDDQAFSAALAPVPDGVTDLGTIVLGQTVCVRGRVRANRCADPVTATLDLFLEIPGGPELPPAGLTAGGTAPSSRWRGAGAQTPVGPVFPDENGNFCVELRPYRRYFLRRDPVECYCGRTPPCEATLAVTDPAASGGCGDPGAACQDLGTVEMQCDFFCGS